MANYQKKGTVGKRGMSWERNGGVLGIIVGASLMFLCVACYLWSMALRTLLCAASLSYNFSEDVALGS